MAQQFLDEANVGAGLEQMDGAGMTQLVGMKAHAEPAAVASHDAVETAAPEPPTAHRKQESSLAEGWPEFGATALEVVGQSGQKSETQRQQAKVASLAVDEHFPAAQRDVVEIQASALAPAQAQHVEQLEQQAVPQTERGGLVGQLEQAANQRHGQHPGRTGGLARQGQLPALQQVAALAGPGQKGPSSLQRLVPKGRGDRATAADAVEQVAMVGHQVLFA